MDNTQYLGLGSWTTHSTWGWVHGQHTVPGAGFMDNTISITWGWIHGQHTVPGAGFMDNTQYLGLGSRTTHSTWPVGVGFKGTHPHLGALSLLPIDNTMAT